MKSNEVYKASFLYVCVLSNKFAKKTGNLSEYIGRRKIVHNASKG